MKTNEIEVIGYESDVEVLGVEHTEMSILENEDAFIVNIDEYSDFDAAACVDMDDMPQDDSF